MADAGEVVVVRGEEVQGSRGAVEEVGGAVAVVVGVRGFCGGKEV